MSILNACLLHTMSAAIKQYIEDVFASYAYQGTTAALSVVNGVKNPSVVLTQSRDNGSTGGGSRGAFLWDIASDTYLNTSNTNASTPIAGQVQSNASGFTVNSGGPLSNYNQGKFASLAFSEATRFMKRVVVTHTNGASDTVDLSSLSTIGMALVKRLNGTGSWMVWHKDHTAGKLTYLEQLTGETTDSSLSVSGTNLILSSALASGTYLVLAWADDTSLNGLVRCGSYVGGMTEVSSTQSTDGTINIPANTTLLSVVARGGTGGDNSWYEPGQPYIAPTPERYSIWRWSSGEWFTTFTDSNPGYPTSDSTPSQIIIPYDQAAPSVTYTYTQSGPNAGVWTINQHTWNVYLHFQGNPYDPGQPYIAPSSGGGIFYGPSTTLTIGGVTTSYQGGYGNVASPVSQTFLLSGIAQNISYVVGSGGSLKYTYSVPSSITDINLGWEPQCVLLHNLAGGNWVLMDTSRGLTSDGVNRLLYLNNSSDEVPDVASIAIHSKGFTIMSGNTDFGANGQKYEYIAFRRPNKTPTNGSQVYNAIARTGTNAAATISGVGFAFDVMLSCVRTTSGGSVKRDLYDRFRGPQKCLSLLSGAAETTSAAISAFTMDGFITPSNDPSVNASSSTYIYHFFKRAPGVFDEVEWIQTVSDSPYQAQSVPHSLQVTPELVISKCRDNSSNKSWMVTGSVLGLNKYLTLDSTAALATDTVLSADNSTNFYAQAVDTLGRRYMSLLFTTCPGISKVGTYVGNGGIKPIDCGFAAGARFVMIKRIDSVGDWYLWDTVRGITANEDPRLSLNTTVAEVTTDDSIDPYAAGFYVNQVTATQINVNAASYVFVAFA